MRSHLLHLAIAPFLCLGNLMLAIAHSLQNAIAPFLCLGTLMLAIALSLPNAITNFVGAKHLDDYLSGNPQISISKWFALLVSMENEEGEAFGLKNLEKKHKLSLECFAPTTPF